MKFTTVLFSVALIASATAQTTTTTSSAPVNTNSSYGPAVDKCLATCKPENKDYVSCAATCLGNPNPTPEQVNETTKCAAACPQGNGTQAETEAYGKCQRACTVKYFLPSPDSVPDATQTDGTSSPTATDSNGNRVNTTSTHSSTSSTPTNGASAMVYSASFAGVVAAFAAFLAL